MRCNYERIGIKIHSRGVFAVHEQVITLDNICQIVISVLTRDAVQPLQLLKERFRISLGFVIYDYAIESCLFITDFVHFLKVPWNSL